MNEDEARLFRSAARELIARHGRGALALAIEREEAARVEGDNEGADAWLEIAMTAAAMLRDARRS